MTKKCKHIKDDGKKCKAYKMAGSEYCYFHDPKLVKERLAAAARGGKLKARLSQVKDIVAEAVATRPVIRELKFNSLDDIQLFGEDQMQYIEDNKKFSKLSQADRVLMLRWCDWITKVLCLKGLDAEGRISAMEDQIRGSLFGPS